MLTVFLNLSTMLPLVALLLLAILAMTIYNIVCRPLGNAEISQRQAAGKPKGTTERGESWTKEDHKAPDTARMRSDLVDEHASSKEIDSVQESNGMDIESSKELLVTDQHLSSEPTPADTESSYCAAADAEDWLIRFDDDIATKPSFRDLTHTMPVVDVWYIAHDRSKDILVEYGIAHENRSTAGHGDEAAAPIGMLIDISPGEASPTMDSDHGHLAMLTSVFGAALLAALESAQTCPPTEPHGSPAMREVV